MAASFRSVDPSYAGIWDPDAPPSKIVVSDRLDQRGIAGPHEKSGVAGLRGLKGTNPVFIEAGHALVGNPRFGAQCERCAHQRNLVTMEKFVEVHDALLPL
jgi:hypothetical protein